MGLLPVFCIREQRGEEGFRDDGEMWMYALTSSMKVPLGSSVRTTADHVGGKRPMRELHEAMNLVVRPPQRCKLCGLVVKIRELVE